MRTALVLLQYVLRQFYSVLVCFVFSRFSARKLFFFRDSPAPGLRNVDRQDADSALSGFCFVVIDEERFSTFAACCLGFV